MRLHNYRALRSAGPLLSRVVLETGRVAREGTLPARPFLRNTNRGNSGRKKNLILESETDLEIRPLFLEVMVVLRIGSYQIFYGQTGSNSISNRAPVLSQIYFQGKLLIQTLMMSSFSLCSSRRVSGLEQFWPHRR